MAYPGNPSLAAPVKDRVLSTFRQAVTLFKQGRVDDVASGCNLILQMDPMFDPAKKLLEKSQNPALAIDVDSLLPAEEDASLAQAREAMASRDFDRVVQLTTEILTNDLMNDEARILGDEAREKLEAGPFIEQFVRKCDQQLAAGNVPGATADLEKARALDPTHPEVQRVARALATKSAPPPPPPPPAPSSSFVVDDVAQSVSGRGTAQASDFGFTFEEDAKPSDNSFANFSFDTPAADPGFGGFSFDTPAETPLATPATPPPPPPVSAPAPPEAANEFDFSTASISTSPEDQKKIDQYLSDGDRAFTAGDYQQAIDLWSRIFLIDVTNDDASGRIEKAKAKRREIDQKVETILATGMGALERGDAERARTEFAEALRIDPNNVAAQEQMERLTSGVTEGGAAAYEQPYIAPSPSPGPGGLDDDFFDDPATSLDSRTPPDPTVAATVPETAAEKKRSPAAAAKKEKVAATKRSPAGALIAAIVLLALAAGGWYYWSHFMNEPEADPAASEGVFTRASTLSGRGKFDEAIAVLQDIKPGDPQHDRALVMIADLQQKKTKSAQLIDGKPAAQYYEERLAAARAAFDQHDYATAKTAFEEAQRVKPLPPDVKPQYDMSAERVSKLDAAKALFAEQKYSEAISNLQPLLVEDPKNANVQRMIVDAHFNLGAKALQEARTGEAVREFEEVLKVSPNDELAKRSRDLAQRYDGQPRDLLYQIYVKYLPLRRPA